MAKALRAVKSFSADISGSQQGQAIKGTVQVAMPDRVHMTVSGMMGPQTLEIIAIKDVNYVRLGNEAWQKMAGGTGMIDVHAVTDPEVIAQELLAPGVKVTPGGTATVRGESCQQFLLERNGDVTTLCIGKDNLPRRVVQQGIMLELYGFNQEVSITPPIP